MAVVDVWLLTISVMGWWLAMAANAFLSLSLSVRLSPPLYLTLSKQGFMGCLAINKTRSNLNRFISVKR